VKTWRVVALVLVAGLGVVVTRVFWDGRAALADGDAAMARGDPAAALVGWRRAARWYAPLAPHVADAYERMEALARAADERDDPALALDAWRAIRSSVLSTRSVYTPYADRLDAANGRIAALMAKQEVAMGKTDEAARRELHLGLLLRDESPSVPWTLVALAGFAAWVGGGFWLARRGVTDEDKLERRTAARAAVLIAVGLLVWMLGLYRA
jgi:hypothetical protein